MPSKISLSRQAWFAARWDVRLANVVHTSHNGSMRCKARMPGLERRRRDREWQVEEWSDIPLLEWPRAPLVRGPLRRYVEVEALRAQINAARACCWR